MTTRSIDDMVFTGSRNGPDNVARSKTSWQAADKQRLREDVAELQAIEELLEHGCPPYISCEACRLGIHDGDPCLCCGHID